MRTLRQSTLNNRLQANEINRKYRNVEGLWHFFVPMNHFLISFMDQ